MTKPVYKIVRTVLAERAISLFAVAISFIAVGISYVQLEDARKHNQLSLKPIIQVVHNNISNPDSDQGIFHIHNDGVGPATFTDVTISLNDHVINKPEVEAWREVFRKTKVGSAEICLQVGALEGSSLPPGSDHFMLRVKDPGIMPGPIDSICENWMTRSRLNLLLKGVKIRVVYKSVYNQEFVADSRSAINSL